MIKYDDLEQAFVDIVGQGKADTVEELDRRIEMSDVDPDELRAFLFDRVMAITERYERSPDWIAGFTYAGLEFMLIGALTGKAEALSKDLDLPEI